MGITVIGLDSYYGMYSNIDATRLDTLYAKSGSSYYPSAYHDLVTTNDANVTYHSTNVGLDVQQVFSTTSSLNEGVYNISITSNEGL